MIGERDGTFVSDSSIFISGILAFSLGRNERGGAAAWERRRRGSSSFARESLPRQRFADYSELE